jgi:protein-tyrosine kinase
LNAGESLLDYETEERDALVAELALSTEAVEAIRQTAGATRLGFWDAAVELGLVTKDAIAAAAEKLRDSKQMRSTSVVTVAFGRPEPDRSHPTKTGGVVTPGPQLFDVLNPASSRSDAVRSLRTELLLNPGNDKRNGLLAILSSGVGEGRSQLTAELAICFAQLGRRTLLVDTDLRNPSLHTIFGTAVEWGLAQAIAFNEAAQVRSVEGVSDLSVLFAGAPMPNPLEMLTNPAFHRMVVQWQSEFEFVIFDTPPIGRFADGLLIAKVTGRALMLTRAGHSRLYDIKNALRRLEATGAEIVGSVLSHF